MPRDYSDRLTHPLPTARDMWRILREGGFRNKSAVQEAAAVPVRKGPLPPVPGGGLGVTWVGHATYLVRIGGKAVLTDPVWSPRLPGRIPRLTPVGIAWDDLPPLDAVVVSHNHYDHLDARTMRRMPRDVRVLVPAGLKRWFDRRGFTNVTEHDWWEGATHAGLRFDCVPVHHWSRRTPWDTNKSLWCGWVMSAGGRAVYFGGDTAYGHFFTAAAERHPRIDVALLPVGAYAPRWFMQGVHMDPDEAVQACADLGSPRLASMHWGTFPLTREPVMEPIERLRTAWAKAGRPRDDLWDLAVGESRVLPAVAPPPAGRAARAGVVAT